MRPTGRSGSASTRSGLRPRPRVLAAFGSLDMTAAHATRGGSGAPRLLGAFLHPRRRTTSLTHLAPSAWRTIPPTCPRQTSSLKRPRGVSDARPATTACDTPCAVAATLRCSVDSSAAHFAEETGWSSYVTDGGLTGVPSWPFLALRCLIARPCRAVAGRPYVHATRCMIPSGGACP